MVSFIYGLGCVTIIVILFSVAVSLAYYTMNLLYQTVTGRKILLRLYKDKIGQAYFDKYCSEEKARYESVIKSSNCRNRYLEDCLKAHTEMYGEIVDNNS